MRTAERTTQSHCLPQILVQSYLIVLEIYGVLFFLEMFFPNKQAVLMTPLPHS